MSTAADDSTGDILKQIKGVIKSRVLTHPSDLVSQPEPQAATRQKSYKTSSKGTLILSCQATPPTPPQPLPTPPHIRQMIDRFLAQTHSLLHFLVSIKIYYQ